MAGELTRELDIAAQIARQAGAVLLEVYKTDFKVESKGLNDPVTEADRRANELIVGALRREFPQDAVVAEESDNQAAHWVGRDRIWYVDPMDGTQEFVNRNGEFSVMIGLALSGEAKLGVVYRPVGDELYLGVVGKGAWVEKSGQRTLTRVSKCGAIAQARLIQTRSRRNEKTDAFVKAIAPASVEVSGSVGLKVSKIALNRADVYFEVSSLARAWDSCAPEAILRAAGGELTDLSGKKLKYGVTELRMMNGLAGSNGKCHGQLIQRIAPLVTNSNK